MDSVIDDRIRYTWGGAGGKYGVYLCFRSLYGVVYQPVMYDLESCYEAQQQVHRLNAAIDRWRPEMLHPDAELPGKGFQYSRPEKGDWHA